jgi:hypothetical protein
MYRAVIAAIDASRARFFSFEREVLGGEVHENIVEHTDLVNLARRQRPSELFTETRPATRNVGTVDDHRDAHIDNMDAEFARSALTALRQLIDEHKPRRVVLCAAPRMLGVLRGATSGLIPDNLEVDMLARDLVKLSPTELRALLVAHNLLPGGRAAALMRAPRGTRRAV